MAETHMDMMAQQLEDIAKDITGTTVTKRSYAWDRIDNAVTTIAEAVGAEIPEKKYNTKKERVAALVTAIADVDVNPGMEDGLVGRTLSTYVNSTATSIGEYAFYSYKSLATVSFPACTNISGHAFDRCSSLTTASFPVCTTIGTSAFSMCSSLTTADFPVCTNIGGSAFQNCSSLTTIDFPVCTTIEGYAFQNCSSLTTADFPACTNIGGSAFLNCRDLTTVDFPVCTTIGTAAFAGCSSLIMVSFPACTNVSMNVFSRCYNLVSLYLLGSSYVTLANSNALSSTPIGGYTTSTGGQYGSIYVPASMIDTYKTMTNWTYFSSRFVAYSA